MPLYKVFSGLFSYQSLRVVMSSAYVYHSNMHAFDMLRPDLPESLEAVRKFEEAFAFAAGHYYAEND